MPRRQVEVLECDRCGNPGKPYMVQYDHEGTMEFILCEKHNGPLEKLKGLSYGTWKDPKPKRKRGIQKVDLSEITGQ